MYDEVNFDIEAYEINQFRIDIGGSNSKFKIFEFQLQVGEEFL